MEIIHIPNIAVRDKVGFGQKKNGICVGSETAGKSKLCVHFKVKHVAQLKFKGEVFRPLLSVSV